MDNNDWGLQVGNLGLEDKFSSDTYMAPSAKADEHSNIILSDSISFPLELIYQVLFVGGKRGSGKSFTAGVMMEEFNRLGLQFVCFDTLDAHGGLSSLNGVEAINPSRQETINMTKLVNKLKNSGSSVVVNMSGLPLEMQQKVIAEYCEAILAADMHNRGLMTLFEECQDFVPQMGRPESFPAIVRLCKLGRAKGYGAILISQRPAAVSKEALSQASIYMIHNVINTKDLDALKEQLSFGTDKATIKKILDGITYAEAGEMVCYAPEYFKEQGYVVVGKVDRPRRTEHTGRNIDVRANIGGHSPISALGSETVFDSFEPASLFESDNDDYDDDIEFKEVGDSNPTFEWTPHDLDDTLSLDAPDISEGSGTMKAVAAIGLISTGIYFITRGLARRND